MVYNLLNTLVVQAAAGADHVLRFQGERPLYFVHDDLSVRRFFCFETDGTTESNCKWSLSSRMILLDKSLL